MEEPALVGDEAGDKRPAELRATASLKGRKLLNPSCLEKPLVRLVIVPQTDTGRRVENTYGNGEPSLGIRQKIRNFQEKDRLSRVTASHVGA